MRLALFIVLSAVLLTAADRDWQNGKLLEYSSGESSKVTGAYTYGENVGVTTEDKLHFSIAVQIGDTVYVGERSAFKVWGAKKPLLTENAEVRVSISGDSIYLVDENKREFKFKLLKKRKLERDLASN